MVDKIKTRKDLIKYTENLKLTNIKAEQQRTRDINIIKDKIKKLKNQLEE